MQDFSFTIHVVVTFNKLFHPYRVGDTNVVKELRPSSLSSSYSTLSGIGSTPASVYTFLKLLGHCFLNTCFTEKFSFEKLGSIGRNKIRKHRVDQNKLTQSSSF